MEICSLCEFFYGYGLFLVLFYYFFCGFVFIMNRIEVIGILSKWKWLVVGVVVVFVGLMYIYGFNRNFVF